MEHHTAARTAELLRRVDLRIAESAEALAKLHELRAELLVVHRHPARIALNRIGRALTLHGCVDLLLCWSAAVMVGGWAGLLPSDPARMPLAFEATLLSGALLFVALHFRAVKNFFTWSRQ